jgi:hypothetical protein
VRHAAPCAAAQTARRGAPSLKSSCRGPAFFQFAHRLGAPLHCAKNATEKTTAESIARRVNGVKAVKNEIAIRP